MQSLSQLKSRLDSLQELRTLIRALRAMAALRVQEAQASLAGVRRYAEVVERAIAECALLLPKSAIAGMSNREQAANGVLLAICSDHGFVGAYNERLLDEVQSQLHTPRQLIIVGRRGSIIAKERGITVDLEFPMASHVGGILQLARSIAQAIGEKPTAHAVFTGHGKIGQSKIIAESILPIDEALLEKSTESEKPLHHLPAPRLLEQLADEYLLSEITRILMESVASENDARLRVMQSADDNIGDRLDKVRKQTLWQRQDSITSELQDIVTAAQTILSPDSNQ